MKQYLIVGVNETKIPGAPILYWCADTQTFERLNLNVFSSDLRIDAELEIHKACDKIADGFYPELLYAIIEEVEL